MAKIIFQVLFFLLSASLPAQILIPFSCAEKYGLADATTGKQVVPCRFDSIELDPKTGIFSVKMGEKWRLLQNNGVFLGKYEFPFRPRFFDFLSDVSSVPVANLVRIQDSPNDGHYFEGEECCYGWPWGVYNLKDGYFSDIVYVRNPTSRSPEYLASSGISPAYFEMEENKFRTGKLLVTKPGSGQGFIDQTGRESLAPHFSRIIFVDSLNLVVADSAGRLALADANGKLLTPFLFSEIRPAGGFFQAGVHFEKELSDVEAFKYSLFGQGWSSKTGLLDRRGKLVVDTIFESVYLWQDSLFFAKMGGKMGVVSGSGRTVLPFQYDFLTNSEQNELIFQQNGKRGLLNRTGQILQPAIFEYLEKWPPYFVFKKNGLSGVMDSTGKILFEKPFEIIFLHPDLGLAVFSENKKQGLVNFEGKQICPPKYVRIERLWKTDNFKVLLNKEYGVISKTGQVLISPKYFEIESHTNSGNFIGNTSNGWDIFDKNGRKIASSKDKK